MKGGFSQNIYLVDPASSHMLVLKIKPCMPKYKLSYGKTADGSIDQLSFVWRFENYLDNPVNCRANTCIDDPIGRPRGSHLSNTL